MADRREQKPKPARQGGNMAAYKSIRKGMPPPTRRLGGDMDARRERKDVKRRLREWEE